MLSMASCTIRSILSVFFATSLSAFSYGLSYDITVIRSDLAESLDGYDLNNHGEVIGRAQLLSGETAHFIYRNGKVEYIVIPEVLVEAFRAFNDTGTIVGDYWSDDILSGSFLYKEGVFSDLGAFSKFTKFTEVADVNNNGQAVGGSFDEYRHMNAYISENGVIKNLGTLGGVFSQAFGMNNMGQVVGMSLTATNSMHAFLYDGGTMIDLNVETNTSSWLRPSCINDRREIIGSADSYKTGYNSFLYANGSLTGFRSDFQANWINNLGVVAGSLTTASGRMDGAICENGHYYNVNDLLASPRDGWSAGLIYKINDGGQILCYGYAEGHYPELWLLTPHAVPEPASFVGLAGALSLIVAHRRKRL